MAPAILDTDVLSLVLKRRNDRVLARADQYVAEHGVFAFSLITRYEILRGIRARGAPAQERVFARFCRDAQIMPITDETIDLAADLYADLHHRGELITDADLIIAATAMQHGRVVVTANVRHFARIPGLVVEDWTTDV